MKNCFSGKDYIGNKYYEIPADPSVGRRKPKRWYFPPKGRDFQDPIPAEWQAWLRKTRYLKNHVVFKVLTTMCRN